MNLSILGYDKGLAPDLKITRSGSLTPGAHAGNFFKLSTNSPAIGQGINLSEVSTVFLDYVGYIFYQVS